MQRPDSCTSLARVVQSVSAQHRDVAAGLNHVISYRSSSSPWSRCRLVPSLPVQAARCRSMYGPRVGRMATFSG
eukprot:766671-Hanusia_phi.AAC.4